jgi:hypothetical protein
MTERRKNGRVFFERGLNVYIMAIDGTWRRSCTMEDVSESGVRLTIADSIEKLNLKEFFLVLSSTGLAYRRCQLIRVNGNQIGASFVRAVKRNAAGRRGGVGAPDEHAAHPH